MGPSVVEEFIFLNQEELRKRKVFAPHHKNTSRDEYKAIKDLQNNKDIVIKPADKGGAVVVMDLKDYLAEGYKQLSDGNVYKKLSESKTLEYHNLIKSYLKHC